MLVKKLNASWKKLLTKFIFSEKINVVFNQSLSKLNMHSEFLNLVYNLNELSNALD